MDEEKKDGMGDCMACPHCGEPIYLSGGKDKEQEKSWEDDLRETMSPQNPGNEGGGY